MKILQIKKISQIILSLAMLMVFFIPSGISLAAGEQKAYEMEWNKTFGTSAQELGGKSVATSDGGCLLYREAQAADGDNTDGLNGDDDIWIIKIDANGGKEWDKTFGTYASERAESVICTADRGYLIAGVTGGSGGDNTDGINGQSDWWIIKTDEYGNKEWDKTFGTSYGETPCYSVVQAENGDYILAGSVAAANGDNTDGINGEYDYWVIRIDSSGNKIWDKTYGTSEKDDCRSIILTNDNGFMLTGITGGSDGDNTDGNHGGNDIWCIKLDENGNKQWDKSFGTSSGDTCLSAICTSDGGYLLPIYTYGSDGDMTDSVQGERDFWIVKIDSIGNIEWDKTFGTTKDDIVYAVVQTPDDGFLLSGDTYGDDGDNTDGLTGVCDFWIIKTDSEGNKQWDKTYGTTSFAICRSVSIGADNSYILTGYVYGDDGDNTDGCYGPSDYWVIKMSDADTPKISSLSPENNSVNQEVGMPLTIEFDEKIAKGTGNISLKKYSDDSTVEIFNAATSSQINYTDDNTGLVINPTNDLESGTKYYVEIENTAVKDLADNYFQGTSHKGIWCFTTKPDGNQQFNIENDSGVARLVDWYTAEIEVDKGITIFVDDGLSISGTIRLYRYIDGEKAELIQFYDVGDMTGEATLDTYTNAYYAPSMRLEYAADYYIDFTGVSVSTNVGTVIKNSGEELASTFSTEYVKLNQEDETYDYSEMGINIDPVTRKELLEYQLLAQIAYRSYSKMGTRLISVIEDSVLAEEGGGEIWEEFDIQRDELYRSFIGSYKIIESRHTDSDFDAIACFDETRDEVIIAIRGSEGGFTGPDWQTDFDFWLTEQLSDQFKDAKDFYDDVRANEEYKDKDIIFVGHSLGGALAGFMSMLTDCEAHCFDGAVGHIVDLTYLYFNDYDYYNEFKGVDQWRFINHTDEPADVFAPADVIQHTNDNYFYGVDYYKNSYHVIVSGTIDSAFSALFSKHHIWSTLTYSPGEISINEISATYKPKDSWFKMTDFPYVFGECLGTSLGDTIKFSPESEYNIIYGGDGADTIYGGVFDEIIVGDRANDILDGKRGDDTYIYSKGDGWDKIYDWSGNDVILLKGFEDGAVFTIEDDNTYKNIFYDGEKIISISKNRNALSIFNSVELRVNDTTKKLQDWNDWKNVKKIVARCPVRMEVYDSENNLIITLKNGEEGTWVNEHGYFHVNKIEGTDDYEKIAYVNGDGYYVKMIGEDTGVMDYSISELNDEGLPVYTYLFEDVEVKKDTVVTATSETNDVVVIKVDYNNNGDTTTLTRSSKIEVTDISLDSDNLELIVGETAQLTATISPYNSDNKAIIWTSTDDDIAMVDSDGNVYAISPGDVTITVNAEGTQEYDTCVVAVIEEEEEPVTASASNDTLENMLDDERSDPSPGTDDLSLEDGTASEVNITGQKSAMGIGPILIICGAGVIGLGFAALIFIMLRKKMR